MVILLRMSVGMHSVIFARRGVCSFGPSLGGVIRMTMMYFSVVIERVVSGVRVVVHSGV